MKEPISEPPELHTIAETIIITGILYTGIREPIRELHTIAETIIITDTVHWHKGANQRAAHNS